MHCRENFDFVQVALPMIEICSKSSSKWMARNANARRKEANGFIKRAKLICLLACGI
jgi:hypothetical protein